MLYLRLNLLSSYLNAFLCRSNIRLDLNIAFPTLINKVQQTKTYKNINLLNCYCMSKITNCPGWLSSLFAAVI